MKFRKLIVMSITVLLLFSSCTADNSESVQSTSDISAENTTVQEKTTIPPAQGLEEESSDSQQIAVNNGNAYMCEYGKRSGTDKTVTGLEPLDLREFEIIDTDKFSEFSAKSVSHSYGVAKDEEPHLISVENQRFFDEKSFDAVCYDSKTEEKVLYLTFDCGYENGYTSKILDVLKEKQITAAFFCTLPQVRDNEELIARMINEGHIVGNHSVNHPDFSSLSANEIIEEVKGFDDYMRERFGYSSLYFRYPEGRYSEKSTAILNELGYKCVFWSLAYADWDVEDQKGAAYAHETVVARFHPGAVILLHSVSSDNANALSDIIDTAEEMGYVFKSLEALS